VTPHWSSGDPAIQLLLQPSSLAIQVYDLAEEWRALTGLPFVFACVAVQSRTRAYESRSLARDFRACQRRGLNQTGRTGGEAMLKLCGCRTQTLLSYLRENVNYEIGRRERSRVCAGYFELAYEYGSIPEIRPALAFS
jgi:chorismate dehydratase